MDGRASGCCLCQQNKVGRVIWIRRERIRENSEASIGNWFSQLHSFQWPDIATIVKSDLITCARMAIVNKIADHEIVTFV